MAAARNPAVWWPLCLAAAVPAFGLGAMFGYQTVQATRWEETALNPSEAIVLKDFAQAMRRIEAGESATVAYPVTAQGREVTPGMVTPLEAAVRMGERELVEALLPHAATMEPSERRRLACLAVALHEEGLAEMLNGGPLTPALCD